MKILVTGIAGFIGFHIAKKLVDTGHNVIGILNLARSETPDNHGLPFLKPKFVILGCT